MQLRTTKSSAGLGAIPESREERSTQRMSAHLEAIRPIVSIR